ncbi:hypothetical protein AAFC00_000622 [Neodothiora populina]|uniref:Nudix hydrolase domain-containing protein n=1 Tax=Neodothiora populina TaxID=2781224 RepID=A0ABR3PDI2_9PEZI
MTETKMQLVDWLDDLCVRFLVNLPQEELQETERICFQIEEAQWFYEDFIRPLDPTLPQLNLSEFASRILRHCPLTAGYSDELHEQAFKSFLTYKTRVPVRGAILLDEDMDKILLVKGYKKNATWSFPRGKINKNEDDLVCAIREVWEETGYDIEGAGLVPNHRNVHYIDVTMREQHLRMFVFRNVPLDTPFEPQTRKEISKIQWYRLDGLPTYNNKRRGGHHMNGDADSALISANKLYMVAPFLPALRRWINQQRKRDAQRASHAGPALHEYHDITSDAPSEPEPSRPRPPNVEYADPADELKRMLSLATIAPPTPSVAVTESAPTESGAQAGMLLAMLRGPTASFSNDTSLPRTPMEQLMEPPNEPQSPHVHHVRPSSQATRQPPPDYLMSADARAAHDTVRLEHAMYMNNSQPRPQDNMSLPNYMDPPYLQTAQAQQHLLLHPSQPQYMPGINQQQHPSTIHSREHMMSLLQPQGRGAIAHGPSAPKASQLPPPNMNNHTMSLLNAFKTPSTRHAQLAQQPYMQQPPPNNIHSQQQSAFSQRENMHFEGPPPQSANQQPGRSLHQNSLLDLFKSPTATKTTPVGTDAGQSHNRAASLQAAPQTPQPQEASMGPSAGPHQQRSATMAMMTRTLPRAKASSPSKAGESYGGGQPGSDLFPAKQQVQRMQTASFSAEPASTQDHRSPFSHAATGTGRPSSRSTSGTAVRESRRSSSHVASPRRDSRSSRNGEQTATAPNYTILQRPAALSEAPQPAATSPPPQPPQQSASPKPFQPQLLRRPQAEEGVPGSDMSFKRPIAPRHSETGQRDTLLALFAKGDQGRTKSIDQGRGQAGPPADPAPSLPMDPAAFSAKMPSRESVVSSNEGGMKSPATPVEAKGFLLDYLNGVVKSAQH